MFARTGRCVVALALCLSVGGHWFCLQSVAWARMVANHSQHCSFTQAIAQTFDGDHPCDLCKHITKARDTEKKQDRQTSTGKTDLFYTTGQVFLPPPFVSFKYPDLISVSIRGWQQPPSPHPMKFYADAEVPVYQNFVGNQITAPVLIKATVAYEF